MPSPVVKNVFVINPEGLAAKQSAHFLRVSSKFTSSVKIRKGDREVDGKSILGIMTLAAEKGATLTLVVEGPDAEEAAAALERLFWSGFDDGIASDDKRLCSEMLKIAGTMFNALDYDGAVNLARIALQFDSHNPDALALVERVKAIRYGHTGKT